jgi:hypothetical protein
MSAKKTLAEKTLADVNAAGKQRTSILRFKADPAAELARLKKEVDQLHAAVMASRTPVKPRPSKPSRKLTAETEVTTLVVPRKRKDFVGK